MHRLLQARRSGEFDILSRFESLRSSSDKNRKKKCNDGSVRIGKTWNYHRIALRVQAMIISVEPVSPVNIYAVPVDVLTDAHQLKRIATDTSVENARTHTASMHIRKWFTGL